MPVMMMPEKTRTQDSSSKMHNHHLFHQTGCDDKQFVFSQMHHHYHAASAGRSLPRLSLGHKGLDQALGGGVLCRRVHLITGGQSASVPSAFSLALVAMMIRAKKAQGPIVWCGPVRGGLSGHLFGAGLAELGLCSEQFIFVRESHPLRRLAACEEALATNGLAAVIHEYGPLYEKTALWQKAARRLQLACERGSATAFLIGQAGAASGFETAWHIASAKADDTDTTDWRPMWDLSLDHVKGGYPASARVIWDRASSCFVTPQSRIASVSSSWDSQPYRHHNHHQMPHWQRSAS